MWPHSHPTGKGPANFATVDVGIFSPGSTEAMNVNPFESIEAKLDALASDVRSLKSRTNDKPERKRRVGLSEAAPYVGLAESTLYKKCHFRTVPHGKVGGRLFFDLDELDKWLDAGRRRTVAEVAVDRMEGNK